MKAKSETDQLIEQLDTTKSDYIHPGVIVINEPLASEDTEFLKQLEINVKRIIINEISKKETKTKKAI